MSPEHWNELFRMLNFPKGTVLANLTFGDVLQATDGD